MVVEVCNYELKFHFSTIALKVGIFPLTSVFFFFTIFPFRSFVVSGGSAVYVAAYSVFYFVTKLEIDEFVPTLLYFSYTVRLHSQKTTGVHKFFLQVIMVATFWLLTGTIGFYAAYTFIRKIYGAVKID